MKNRNIAVVAATNAALFSLLSFSAIAETSAPVSLEEKVQLNMGNQLASEGNKYAQIVSLAASNEDELTARRYDAANAYKKWYELKSAVAKHYPSSQDYMAVEAASREYARANKAFIDLQKRILASNNIPLDKVTTRIIASE